LRLRDIINKNIPVQHPTMPIDTVDLIEIYDAPTRSNAHAKNVVIFGKGNVDRSPCGTGTCAKLAVLYEAGKIGLKEPFVHESILGSTFKSEILEETMIKDIKAIVPQITGSAYIIGLNHIIIDNRDPYKHGFLLGI
jgi:proline racemase